MAKNPISDYEIGIIKALIDLKYENQDILAYINRYREANKLKHINSGRISDIKNGKRGKDIPLALNDVVNNFIEQYKTTTMNDDFCSVFKFKDDYIENEESETIEYKQSFGAIKDDKLLKSIQGMANNKGGFIVFGISEENNDSIKKYCIKGIDEKECKSFMQDNKRINEVLNSNFRESIRFERNCKKINQKLVAYIQIFESNDKPLINNNGDIYYRYNAETRKIAKLDLLRIINERKEKELHLTMQKYMEIIFKNGIENSAILNVVTGEVEGKGGNFLINQDLLPKIAFIKEGNFVEKDGAPTLILKGSVEVISADGVIISHNVHKNIDEKYIYKIFFSQQNINKQEAEACIEAMAEFQVLLLPMRYFMQKADMNKDKLIKFLKNIHNNTTKKSFVDKKIENINKNKPEKLEDHNEFIENINDKVSLLEIIEKDNDMRKISVAIMSLNKDQIDKKYILSELSVLYNHCVRKNNKQISHVRKAIAYIDRILFA
ncbi:MAG: ATP-binding protein [Helicobacteraceae bacterium]|nr:ATP-binding protein [Helicobacteraceae bacterium]